MKYHGAVSLFSFTKSPIIWLAFLSLLLSGCNGVGSNRGGSSSGGSLVVLPRGADACSALAVQVLSGQSQDEAIDQAMAQIGKDSQDVEVVEENVNIKIEPHVVTQVDLRGQNLIPNTFTGQATGNRQVTVAVIDSGVDVWHPDLQNYIKFNSGEVPGNGVDDDGNGFVDDVYGYSYANGKVGPDVSDNVGHGTHVSGIVAQQVSNSGLNSNDVKILPVKFLDTGNSGSLQGALLSIGYAIHMGVDVINASWGSSQYSSILDQCVSIARGAGITFIAAAGNNSSNNDMFPAYPANLRDAISVASHDMWGNLSSFSNYGSATVDLAAFGDNVTSTLPGGQYGQMQGTSMAAPQVAGATAVLKSLATTPLTEAGVNSVIFDNVNVTVPLSGNVLTDGELDVAASVANLP